MPQVLKVEIRGYQQDVDTESFITHLLQFFVNREAVVEFSYPERGQPLPERPIHELMNPNAQIEVTVPTGTDFQRAKWLLEAMHITRPNGVTFKEVTE